uniref:Uncharacterized protein AlNc14C53G4097 n=1 Tax=Albugo laibachii Nc14 TaxID=890382 RepID=F0WBQ6_9STRA|nr:conserved hypothetical protein [Albugo laibachii Nc14]CCA20540.1 conserved hypothetical protein [Albugo laibachii Nc14]|eukprot:CCA20540.1 conserved hypothetical protein [Albugo laibachii Nc14]
MLMQEQGVQADVRREDQERINEFGAINFRLNQLRLEKKALQVCSCIMSTVDIIASLQEKLDTLEDAVTELMMGEGDSVHLMIGESFVERSEEGAQEYLEELTETTKKANESLVTEEEELENRHAILKKLLYGRFGDNINLEEK